MFNTYIYVLIIKSYDVHIQYMISNYIEFFNIFFRL